MTPAQAKRERAHLMREIKREEKRKDRARVVGLRARVRELRSRRMRAIAQARIDCKRRRGEVPTLAQARELLRTARAEARATCAVQIAAAHQLKTEEGRARGEHAAELAHQRAMRRIERQAKERKREERPRLAKARTRGQESDDEVRHNIPPELVFLWERVKRQIKGSDRRTRTEAFLDYAHEHPDEELAALEDRTDAMIREHEARERRANVPTLSASASRRRVAQLRAAGCKPKRVRLPDGSEAVLRSKACKVPAIRNPRQPPRAWWDDCIAGVRRAERASGRKVANVRAVCGASWWNLPPSRRAAIVRKLERSRNPQGQAACLALAHAEKAHHARHGGPTCERKGNPRELVSLVYAEQKPGDREVYEYEHEFAGELPTLAMRGGKAQIEGGSYTARDGWLEG